MAVAAAEKDELQDLLDELNSGGRSRSASSFHSVSTQWRANNAATAIAASVRQDHRFIPTTRDALPPIAPEAEKTDEAHAEPSAASAPIEMPCPGAPSQATQALGFDGDAVVPEFKEARCRSSSPQEEQAMARKYTVDELEEYMALHADGCFLWPAGLTPTICEQLLAAAKGGVAGLNALSETIPAMQKALVCPLPEQTSENPVLCVADGLTFSRRAIAQAIVVTPISKRRSALVASETVPPLADVFAAGGLWTELGCSELLDLRAVCPGLHAGVRPALIALLADLAVQFGPRKRLAALRVLVGVSSGGDGRTAKLAALCLNDHGADVRHAAARALASATEGIEQSEEGIEQSEIAKLASACLCPALSDSDPRVCAAAAKALPRLVARGDPVAVSAISAGLRKAEPSVRRAAIASLGEVAMRDDVVSIASVAAAAEGDMDWGVRAAACRVLPRLAERGNEVAYRALMRCLKDTEVSVRHVAMGAIAHLSVRPSQLFIGWAPGVAAGAGAGPQGRRGRPLQQQMCLESPLGLTPPPVHRRRASASPSTQPVSKKRITSGRVGRVK